MNCVVCNVSHTGQVPIHRETNTQQHKTNRPVDDSGESKLHGGAVIIDADRGHRVFLETTRCVDPDVELHPQNFVLHHHHTAPGLSVQPKRVPCPVWVEGVRM